MSFNIEDMLPKLKKTKTEPYEFKSIINATQPKYDNKISRRLSIERNNKTIELVEN